MSRTWKDQPRMLLKNKEELLLDIIDDDGTILPAPKIVGKEAQNFKELLYKEREEEPNRRHILLTVEGKTYRFDNYDHRNFTQKHNY